MHRVTGAKGCNKDQRVVVFMGIVKVSVFHRVFKPHYIFIAITVAVFQGCQQSVGVIEEIVPGGEALAVGQVVFSHGWIEPFAVTQIVSETQILISHHGITHHGQSQTLDGALMMGFGIGLVVVVIFVVVPSCLRGYINPANQSCVLILVQCNAYHNE